MRNPKEILEQLSGAIEVFPSDKPRSDCLNCGRLTILALRGMWYLLSTRERTGVLLVVWYVLLMEIVRTQAGLYPTSRPSVSEET